MRDGAKHAEELNLEGPTGTSRKSSPTDMPCIRPSASLDWKAYREAKVEPLQSEREGVGEGEEPELLAAGEPGRGHAVIGRAPVSGFRGVSMLKPR